KLRPERMTEFHMANSAKQFLAAPGGAIPQQTVPAEPGAMRHQIAKGHVRVGQRICEAEELDVLANGIIPGHLALVNQHRHRRCGERLRRRADGEDGIRGHWLACVQVSDAESLEVDHSAVVNNCYRCTGCLEALHSLRDQSLNLRD